MRIGQISRSTFEAARDKLLKLQQLCTLVFIERRRACVIDCVGDIGIGFGLLQAKISADDRTMQVGHREKSYNEREKKQVELASRQADILLLICEACEIERCLLLVHRAGDEVLHRSLLSRNIRRGFPRFNVFDNTTTVRIVSYRRDDRIRRVHVPLDLADEVKDDPPLGDTEHLGIEVLGVFAAKRVVTLAISIIVRIVNDLDQAVVAYAT
jgi:hypothetical protein